MTRRKFLGMPHSRMAGLAVSICYLALLEGCAPATVNKAYEEAVYTRGSGERGIVLYLHGCDGAIQGGWRQYWFYHLRDKGFLVVAPDSFADSRPTKICGGGIGKDDIYRVRVAQTLHAIKKLRESYPGKKLFVWGHSEGGGVAHRLKAEVDGVITSGYQCGIGSDARTDIPPQVPVLAIQGAKDEYIEESIRYSTFTSLDASCSAVFRSPNRNRMVMEGMGHTPHFQVKELREAVDKFLGVLQ